MPLPCMFEHFSRRCDRRGAHPHIPNSPTVLSVTAILDDFLAQYPAIQSLLETMKSYYITPKIIILFIFGLLFFICGITADDKTPPSTLQIGLPPPKMQLL